MKYVAALVLSFLLFNVKAQKFSGEVFLRDNSALYLNTVYVTNLTEMQTVLANYSGNFSISAKPGDIVRFTSIVTERHDVKVTPEMLNMQNIVELRIEYHDIQEVVVSRFRPTGNLRYDLNSIRKENKVDALKKMIGLPEPKGDGTSPVLPVAGLRDGGLTFSVESIFDILSGERKRKERASAYEHMQNAVSQIRNYLGDDYFVRLKIPAHLIDNFLQFVYSSESLEGYIAAGNLDGVKVPIEKYLPVYQRRLRNSDLQNVLK